MIKKLLPVLAAVVAPAVLFAGSASAATHHKPRTFASCHAKGRHPRCTAKGTVTKPSSLWLHVRAQPRQQVIVGWADECFKGSHKGLKKGGFTATAGTLARKMPMKYKQPDKCVAAAIGILSKNGSSIHVWLTVGK